MTNGLKHLRSVWDPITAVATLVSCGTRNFAFSYGSLFFTRIVKVGPGAFGAQNLLTFEQVKSKCSEMGFKSGAEQFGQCILKLAK